MDKQPKPKLKLQICKFVVEIFLDRIVWSLKYSLQYQLQLVEIETILNREILSQTRMQK